MEKVKAFFITIFSILTSLFGALAIPIILLVACNIIDYFTGIVASKFRNQEISSYVGIRGIVKKVSMWLLIAVGAIVDQLVLYAAETIGIVMPFTFAIACVVAIWLICNEAISILENVNDIGVKLPPFLTPIVSQLKSQIEEKVEVTSNDNSNESEEK